MKRLIVSFILLVMVSIGAMASSPTDSVSRGNVNVVIGGQENEADVERAFKDNVPRDKSVAGMPHFAIVGKNKRFYLGIGANFKASGSFDFGDDMPSSIDFVPSAITPSTPGNGAQTRFSAQASSIYLNFIAMPDNPNKTGLFFAGYFRGENYGFKMQHFYIKYRGLKFGYTHSAFTDNDAVPFTIDEQGASGQVSFKTVNLMWTQPLGKGFSATLGLDAPSIDMAGDSATFVSVNQRVPAIPLWVQYSNDVAHVRLSGMMRVLQYRDMIAQCNRNLMGWGAQLTASCRPLPSVSIYAGAVYGQGIGNYVQDSSGWQLDVVGDFDDLSQAYALPIWSCHAGLEWNISEKLQANLLYSRVNCLYDNRMSVSDATYKSGQYATANLLYKVTNFVKLGVEYNWGSRQSYGRQIDHANRVQCLFSVEI